MRSGYFEAAWSDVSGSPGLPGKLLALALISLIPVFGWVVVFGYLLGWARDLAWGVAEPLPPHVFGNADGELYRRGFFAIVILVLFGLLPLAVATLLGLLPASDGFLDKGVFGLVPALSLLRPVMCVAASLLAIAFAWVGMMRMSIYRRFSPGLQIGRLAAMLHYDSGGIVRLLGLFLIVALSALATIFLLVFVVAGASAVLFFGALESVVQGVTSFSGSSIMATGSFALGSAMVACALAVSTVSVLGSMIILRALGYWTQQFDVPHWLGQDDPMPFELAEPRRQR